MRRRPKRIKTGNIIGRYQHPLKAEFRKMKIRLYMLSHWTGVSESKLSRYLNGIDPMPMAVELKLWDIYESFSRLLFEPD